MHATDSSDAAVRRLVEPSNAILPSELRDRAYSTVRGLVAWRPEDAKEAIAALEGAGAAILKGILWADDGQGDGPCLSVEVDSKSRSHYWYCQRNAGEEWLSLVKRTAEIARRNLPDAVSVGNEFGTGFAPYIRLIRDKNPAKVKAIMDAMMEMVKLDVAALERAYDSVR